MAKTIGDKLGPPGRMEGESHEEYRERRAKEKRMLENYLKGDNVWPTAGKKTEQFLMMQVMKPSHPMDVQTANSIMRAGKGTLVKSRDGVPRSSRRKV